MWVWKDSGEEISSRMLEDIVHDYIDEKFDDAEFEDYLNDMEPYVDIFGAKCGRGTILRKIDPVMFEMMRDELLQFYTEENLYELEHHHLVNGDELCDILGVDIYDIVWKESENDD